MFKTLRAKYVLPELIVSERNVYFMQKSRFLSLALSKMIQIKCPWGIEHYSSLLVVNRSIFKHDRILDGIFQDLCGILIKSHWNY